MTVPFVLGDAPAQTGNQPNLRKSEVTADMLRGGTRISEAPVVPLVAIDPAINGFNHIIDMKRVPAGAFEQARQVAAQSGADRKTQSLQVLHALEELSTAPPQPSVKPQASPAAVDARSAFQAVTGMAPQQRSANGAVAIQTPPMAAGPPLVEVSYEISESSAVDASYHDVILSKNALILVWDTRWPGKPVTLGVSSKPVAVYVPTHQKAYLAHIGDIDFTHAHTRYIVLLVERAIEIQPKQS